MSVLLVCFNAPLAEDLAKRLHDVDVDYFHGLCKRAAERVGYTLTGKAASEDELHHKIMPQILFDATDEIGQVYDAIIVDEGQDFREEYWMAMAPLLRDSGYLYIFYDDNQNIYSGSADFGGLIQESPFPLTRNCRNTQFIHKVVARFHNNPHSLTADGPEGRLPDVIVYRGEDDMSRQLQKLLHRLVNEERVDCEDIVILTPRGEERTRLKPGTRLGMFTLSAFPSRRANTIQATSVYRFKGLERRLVILAEVDSRTKYNAEMVMYVGCSRARTHLVILHDEDAPENLIAHLNAK